MVRQLAAFEQERRDLTSASNFMPASGTLPTYLSSAFSLAARARGVLLDVLRREPLPPAGVVATLPKTTTAATAAPQGTEAAAISETDPVTASVTGNVASVAGQVNVSRQLLDRAEPGIDVWIAADLGAALGTAVNSELLTGAASAGRITGLLTLSAGTAITATTATSVGNLAAAGRLRADVAVAAGVPPDTLLLHPRRAAFIKGTYGTSPTPLGDLYERVIEVPCMPVNVGGTQDALIALVTDDVVVMASEPVIEVNTSTAPPAGVDQLSVRFTALVYVSLLPRQLTSVGRATGAGLAAPSWTA